MAECPSTLSGRHVYAQRERNAEGSYACACGERATASIVRPEPPRRKTRPRVTAEERAARIRAIRVQQCIDANCPCAGNLAVHDAMWNDLPRRWQAERVTYAERAYQDARTAYGRALRALMAAEQRLRSEQAEYDQRAEVSSAV